MDLNRFDDLARSLSAPDSRRSLLARLTALPFAGGLLAILGAEESEGKTGGGGGRRGTNGGRTRDHASAMASGTGSAANLP
ncbi:MAG: hypothetical protein QM692_23930 [Thermomicrobiales bacterium]